MLWQEAPGWQASLPWLLSRKGGREGSFTAFLRTAGQGLRAEGRRSEQPERFTTH